MIDTPLAAVLINPADDEARLVYSDWQNGLDLPLIAAGDISSGFEIRADPSQRGKRGL